MDVSLNGRWSKNGPYTQHQTTMQATEGQLGRAALQVKVKDAETCTVAGLRFLPNLQVTSCPWNSSCLPPANMLAYQHQIVSSDRLPNARRPEPLDTEERKRRSLEKFRRYLDTPAEEDVLVNDNTKAHRKWLIGRWNKCMPRVPTLCS